MNKNLFNNGCYDDKNSKLREGKIKNDPDNTTNGGKKDDNVVCRCFIF